MGRNSNIDSNLLWKIRNNIRKNNWKAVVNLIMPVIKSDDSIPEKKELMDTIYANVIEPWVNGKNVEKDVPRQYEEMFIEFARYMDNKDEQEKILKMLDRIKDSKNPKTQKKVRRQISLMNLTEELLKGENDTNIDVVDKLVDDLESDSDSKTYMEVLSALFGKEFSIDQLELGELEKYLKGVKRIPGDGEGSTTNKYPEDIQVDKRIKFFKEELDIEPDIRFCENGIFAGSILLNIKDSDMVIVERLFEMYKDGSYALANQSSSKSSSTYVLPKDKVMDMIKLETKKSIKQQIKNNESEEWKSSVPHRKNWKENVKKAVERGKNSEKELTDADIRTINDTEELDDIVESQEVEELYNDGIGIENDKVNNDEKVEVNDSEVEIVENEEPSIEQLQEQLKIIEQQNEAKRQTLLRQQLLNQIREEQKKGEELDALIMDAKTKNK